MTLVLWLLGACAALHRRLVRLRRWWRDRRLSSKWQRHHARRSSGAAAADDTEALEREAFELSLSQHRHYVPAFTEGALGLVCV